MSAPEVTVAVPARTRVGEGPHWTPAGELHWVDILAAEIRTTTADGTRVRRLDAAIGTVGAAVPKVSGGFAAATGDGFTAVDDDGGYRVVAPVLGPELRMNDAKCDPYGRFWAGSVELGFAPGRGALHVLAADWSTSVVADGLTQPNGMGWNKEGDTYYLVDTQERCLYAYAVPPGRPATELGERRVLADLSGEEGLPDGMCVDAAGDLWVAMWGGGQVLRLAPDGTVRDRLPVPVRQPSSCAFGGPAGDVLYVTSAREDLDVPDDAPDGSVLAVRGLGTSAPPGVPFAG